MRISGLSLVSKLEMFRLCLNHVVLRLQRFPELDAPRSLDMACALFMLPIALSGCDFSSAVHKAYVVV